jgi:hypothetical protein
MITFIELVCPECNKKRMLRPEGYKVSDRKAKKELPSGEVVEHFVDICNKCVTRLTKLYYTPKKSDAKKVLQALDSGKSLGDKSIEELL